MSKPNEKVDFIKNFIQSNYREASLEVIARELDLSTKYVSRLFKQRNDVSFREQKVQVKMEQAKKLLLTTGKPVHEISDELGYKNPESFMRIFKKSTRFTPSQYRKQFKSAEIFSNS